MLNNPYYIINKENNFSSSCIVKRNFISPDKFYYSENSILSLPKIIEFNFNNNVTKKSCHYHNNFDNSIFLYFRNFDSNNNYFLIPFFQCEQFKCLGCNKIHRQRSEMCCEMVNSTIEIIKGKLTKVFLCDQNIKDAVLENRKLFLKLHFPDLTDMIIIK